MSAEFAVATWNGALRIKADVTTHFAVHRALYHSEQWVLSHRSSGCSVGHFATKKDALKVAKTLEKECPNELAELARMPFASKPRPATRGKWKAAGARLKSALAKARGDL